MEYIHSTHFWCLTTGIFAMRRGWVVGANSVTSFALVRIVWANSTQGRGTWRTWEDALIARGGVSGQVISFRSFLILVRRFFWFWKAHWMMFDLYKDIKSVSICILDNCGTCELLLWVSNRSEFPALANKVLWGPRRMMRTRRRKSFTSEMPWIVLALPHPSR